jgi:diguanylate cyclase (GGDEF)-like protein
VRRSCDQSTPIVFTCSARKRPHGAAIENPKVMPVANRRRRASVPCARDYAGAVNRPGPHLGRCVAWLVAGLLCCLPLMASERGVPALQGAWMPVPAQAGDAPPLHAGDRGMRSFAPERLQVFSPDASWVLLWPGGDWPEAPFVLEIEGAGLQSLTLYAPGSGTQRTAQSSRGEQAWPAHGHLAFAIAQAPARGEPLRLRVDAAGVSATPMRFALRPTVEYLSADARWLAFASACLAIMGAMSLVALFFAVRLRDHAFGYYAGLVMAYATILALQTGYLFQPLGWAPSSAVLHVVVQLATVASLVFGALFLDRFANLRRHLPHGRRMLLGYAGLVATIGLVGVLPGMRGAAQALVGPLLVAGGVGLLLVAAIALVRGSRYAAFFLVGWVPLLAATAVGTLQMSGALATWTGASDATLAAGAFNAMMLSLGLADRSLALRHDRDRARRLADVDSLTGLYNRRAWSERLLALHARTQRDGQPLSLLFQDLDEFKELNDRLGHEAGDSALRAMAAVMRAEIREHDTVGRYGGEEFVVCLPNTSHARAVQAAERIRRRLQERARREPDGALPTVSIGVATLRPDEELSALIRRADTAMYEAKAAGRNRVVAG